MAMSVFVRQEKITVRMGLQSDPIDPTKTCLMFKGPCSAEMLKTLVCSCNPKNKKVCSRQCNVVRFALVVPLRMNVIMISFINKWNMMATFDNEHFSKFRPQQVH